MQAITNSNEFKSYFNGVIERTTHHAGNVFKTIHILAGLILERSNGISALTRGGETKNVIWFVNKITNKRYCLVYDHGDSSRPGFIKVKASSKNGKILAEIDDSIKCSQLVSLFDMMDMGII